MSYQIKEQVQNYYGKELQGTKDLKTDACCTTAGAMPDYIKKAIAGVHDEVVSRYYGCGLIAPAELTGARILDLGSGSGRDCYVLSKLVGPEGYIVGVDMTPEQLAVARRHIEYHRDAYGYPKANVEFLEGYIEKLDDLNLEDNSFDIIVSNCVINLSPDKESVLREAFRVLKPGGELYFSDVYADRRIPEALLKDPVLYGECLSGALYWNDFIELAKKAGFRDPRLVEDRPLGIDNPEIQKKLEGYQFWSATYRLFKIPDLEADCEDYGQKVIYKGTCSGQESAFILDKDHVIQAGLEYKVCGNTWQMLQNSRFAKHFEFIGDFGTHLGIFNCCGQGIPFDRPGADDKASCCSMPADQSAPTKEVVQKGFVLKAQACCTPTSSGSSCCAPPSPQNEDPKVEQKKKELGYIQADKLKELWFHTGTTCNLSCPFCLEGSKPGDDRLGRLTFEDAKPLIDQAVAMGVEQFSFTGGEPFVVKDVLRILDYALDYKPCLVLTNGTDPLHARLKDIVELRDKKHTLSFRISLDHYDAQKHDAQRGQGNFDKAIEAILLLQSAGFKVSVARHSDPSENSAATERAYQELFINKGILDEVKLVAFPDLLTPGSKAKTPFISKDCMTRYHDEKSRSNFMCAFSRMVIKREGQIKITACTLTDDDSSYDQENLESSLKDPIPLKHHRCYSCFNSGASCSEMG
jgi:ubiquinone/menaquinone biosynthesis C-methylase UbiE/sulfatase maturation enzyme AslB (radical SAM superfamily)